MKAIINDLEFLLFIDYYFPIKKKFLRKEMYKQMKKRKKIKLTVYMNNESQRHVVETILHILVKDDVHTSVVPDIQKQLKSNVCPVQFQQACHLAVEKFLSEIASQTVVIRD